MKLDRISFSGKLALLVSFLSAVTLVVGTISILNFRANAAIYSKIANENFHNTLLITRIESVVKDMTRQMIRFGIPNSDAKEMAGVLERYSKASSTARERISQYVRRAGSKAEQEIKDAISRDYDLVEATGTRIIGLYRSGRRDEVNRLLNTDYRAKYNALFESVDKALAFEEKGTKELREEARAKTALGTYLIVGLTLAGVICAFGIGLFWSRCLQSVMARIAARLLGVSAVMKASSRMVSETSERISASTQQQASAIQETASAVEEINSMVARNAQHADESQRKVESVEGIAEKGKRAVEELAGTIQEMVASNQRVQDHLETSNKELDEIIHVIREINNKTQVINDIVFQTRLLSFNASVEAARAGEHGKGFSVVADEVGKLAQMSGNAAKEISVMLVENLARVEKIVDHTRASVTRIVSESKDIVSRGSERARSCDAALDEVTRGVATVRQLMSSITVASREQAVGVSEISKSVAEMSSAMNSNVASSHETSAVAAHFQGQTAELEKVAGELAWTILGRAAQERVNPELAKILDAGVGAHAEWRNKLVRILSGTSAESLDPKVVERDDQCGLGKWIYQHGHKIFGPDQRFEELKENHAHFHRTAAYVLGLAQQDRKDEAHRLIDDGSNFAILSSRVIEGLISLKIGASVSRKCSRGDTSVESPVLQKKAA